MRPTSGAPVDRQADLLADVLQRLQAIEKVGHVHVSIAWTAVAFATGWGDYGGAYQTVQYCKIGDRVYLRGLAACSINRSAGDPILALPAGCRIPGPNRALILDGMSDTGGAVSSKRVDVHDDGTVTVPSNAISAGQYMSLDLDFSTI